MIGEDFYKNKSVLVTGGGGFIGSHLVGKLIDLGAKVYVILHSNKLDNLQKIKDKIECIFCCDISVKESVEKIEPNFEIIFHLAANISVNESMGDPEKIRATNVVGTRNILDLAVKKKVKTFAYVSTSKVYNWSDDPINENSEIRSSSTYSQTKLEGEKLCFEYGKKHYIGITVSRFFNAYGIRQRGGAIALFTKKALSNKNIIIEGNGKQKRDFIHVNDIVQALILVGSKKAARNQTFNFGTGVGTEIIQVANTIIKLTKSSSKITHIKARKDEGSSTCDYQKAKNLLNWEPKISLEDGLKEVIKWVKKDSFFVE